MDDFERQLNEIHDRVLGKALTEEEQNNYTESLFESIKHINDYGEEFWYARELQIALDYKRWDKFQNVISKAMEACKNSENNVDDHFSHVGKIVEAGATYKDVGDIELSRYACYLIVQNGDSRKKVIALGQTYFAVKTRQQELIENFDDLTEDKKRLAIRNEMKIHNKSLAEAANLAGISDPKDYAIFQNKGYQGLYGGLGRKEIHTRKGLKKSQDILDHMGSTELAANLFRATQTDEKLRKDKIIGKEAANRTHYEVGKKVRQNLSEEYKKYQIRYTKICEQKKKIKDTRTPEKLNKELDRLNLLFQKDRITWEYYSTEYDRIEKELKELSAIQPEAEKDFTYLEELLRSDFKKIYEQLTPENRRTFWRSTIEEIHLNEDYTVESVDFL